MSYADEVYKATCRKILEEGYSDAELDVRPQVGMVVDAEEQVRNAVFT